MRSPVLGAWIALALLTILVYLPGLPGGFAFDDYEVIVKNSALALPAWSSTALLDAAFSEPATGLFMRPLAMLTFALNRTLNGPEALAFKLTNLTIHMLNALLVLALMRRLLPLMVPSLPLAGTAWICAALWAVHPINLSAVLYVVQRMTALAATFTLATLVLYAQARTRHLAGQPPVRAWWLLATVSAVLALLTKETAASVLLYLFVIEAAVFRLRGPERLRRGYIVVAICCGLIGAGVLVTFPDALFGAYRVRSFTLSERLFTEARIVVDYLRLLVLPIPGDFTLFHDDIALSHGLFSPPATAAALGVLLLMLTSAWWPRPAFVMFGCYWYLAGHLLESSVLPLELMHEHRNYLPALGPIVALVCAAQHGLQRLDRRAMAVPMSALALLVLAAATTLRAAVWCDPDVQIEFELAHHPQSARLNYDAGRLRIARAHLPSDRVLYDSGIAALERAATLDQVPTLPYAGLLKSAALRNDAPAVAAVIERVRQMPLDWARVEVLRDVIYCQAFGVCAANAGLVGALATAVIDHSELGVTAHRTAVQWLAMYYVRMLHDPAAAIEMFRELVTAAPADGHMQLLLAQAYAVAGRRTEAVAAARAGLATLPWHAIMTARPLREQLLLLVAQRGEINAAA